VHCAVRPLAAMMRVLLSMSTTRIRPCCSRKSNRPLPLPQMGSLATIPKLTLKNTTPSPHAANSDASSSAMRVFCTVSRGVAKFLVGAA